MQVDCTTEAASVINHLGPRWLRPKRETQGLLPGIWPASVRRNHDGCLEVGGVSALQLNEKFGTPLYVVDEAEFRERATRFVRAAAVGRRHNIKVDVYYASKAFLCTAVARWAVESGLHVDICSGGELAVLRAAQVDPKLIGFHGNNKSSVEISEAVRMGVGAIILDSSTEVPIVARAARKHGNKQGVRLRINSGVHASTHDFLATAREDQKFGVPIANAPIVVAQIRQHSNLEFLGLHSHIGSQIFDASGFREAARRLLTLHAELLKDGPIPQLNLGGGFGIAYTAADQPKDVNNILSEIIENVIAVCQELKIPNPDLAFEPGRWITGPAGITLYKVGTIKDVLVTIGDGERATRKYVSVDGGMSDNIRPALYQAQYSSCLASRHTGARECLVRVVGKHCESGDIVVDADYLPEDIEADDLIAVACTGAYCHSLSSMYNMVARPPVIAVRDGESTEIIKGISLDYLLSRDTGLDPGLK